nr:hypothetical protein [Hydrogenibacillus sp. N12]
MRNDVKRVDPANERFGDLFDFRGVRDRRFHHLERITVPLDFGLNGLDLGDGVLFPRVIHDADALQVLSIAD